MYTYNKVLSLQGHNEEHANVARTTTVNSIKESSLWKSFSHGKLIIHGFVNYSKRPFAWTTLMGFTVYTKSKSRSFKILGEINNTITC